MLPAPKSTPETPDADTALRHTEALLATGALQSAIFNSVNSSSIATDAKGVIQIFNVGAERRPISIPGAVSRATRARRWTERTAAYDFAIAEKEHALFEIRRLEARKRRLAQLDRTSAVVSERLEKMDLRKTPAARVLEVLVKLHAAEREELGYAGAEDRPTGSLPAIDDVIKQPE